MTGQPGQPGQGLPERVLRSAQRAILGFVMTFAAAVAERRIRRALRRDEIRRPDESAADT